MFLSQSERWGTPLTNWTNSILLDLTFLKMYPDIKINIYGNVNRKLTTFDNRKLTPSISP